MLVFIPIVTLAFSLGFAYLVSFTHASLDIYLGKLLNIRPFNLWVQSYFLDNLWWLWHIIGRHLAPFEAFNMKKRLRKKKHRGEFREWGCEFNIVLKSSEYFEDFMDRFILKVEELDSYCGGGGKGTQLSFAVALGLSKDKPEDKVDALVAWLDRDSSVKSFSSSQLFDMWYGPFPLEKEQGSRSL